MDLNRKIAEARGEVQALGYITVSSNDGALIEDSTAEAWPRYDEWPAAGELLEEMVEAKGLDAIGSYILDSLELLNLWSGLPAAIRAAYAEWKGLTGEAR